MGLSKTTVADALKGSPKVKASTRELVLKRSREMGYVPNRAAQQLATGRSRLIVAHHPTEEILGNRHVVTAMRGIHRVLSAEGYGILLDYPERSDDNPQILREQLRSGNLGGAILLDRRGFSQEDMEFLADANHPCVCLGDRHEAGHPFLGSVVIEEKSAARASADLLVEAGHRKVAVINSHHQTSVVDTVIDELGKHCITVPKEWKLQCESDPGPALPLVRDLLLQDPRPTAIFVRTDEIALAVMSEARRLNLELPRDLSIASYDEFPYAGHVFPALTTVKIDSFAAGMAGAELFLGLLRGLVEPNPVVTLSNQLVVRDSVAIAPSHVRPIRI